MRMSVWGNGLGIYGVVTLFMVLCSGTADLNQTIRVLQKHNETLNQTAWQNQRNQQSQQNAGNVDVVDSLTPQSRRAVPFQNTESSTAQQWLASIDAQTQFLRLSSKV